MARPPRIDFADAVYHVTSRGNGRAKFFWSDADRLRSLARLVDNVHGKQAEECLSYRIDRQELQTHGSRVMLTCRVTAKANRQRRCASSPSDCSVPKRG